MISTFQKLYLLVIMFVQIFLICLCTFAIAANPGARIIGGEAAPAGEFPFMAAIHVQTSNSKFFCGGSLINNQWILTSGHCVYNAELFTIQLGSNTLTASDSNRQTFATSDYVVHPDFDPERIQNDIALIKLRLPVIFNSLIQPVNLPSISLLNETDVTAVGWGQISDSDGDLSETLQYVEATILSNAECRKVYGNQITDNMACVEGNYNEGTCTGDNGGPLIEHLHRHFWIVGVASFISGNGCESTDPSGFTRTYPYISWINSVVAG